MTSDTKPVGFPGWRGRSLPVVPRLAQAWLWRAAVVCFAVAVLTLPIAWSVRFAAQSGWWWERGFDRFEVERRTGLERAELNRGASELRAYFLNEEERAAITVSNRAGLEEPLFSEREVQHLVDVKRLLERVYDAGWASLGFLVAFVAALAYRVRNRRGLLDRLASASWYAGLGIAGLVAVLAVIAITGFDDAFRQFHLLFFTNDLWQLSSRDRLIQLFPQGFFFETTLMIGATTIAFAGTLAALGYYRRRRRRPTEADAADLPG